MTKSIFLLVLAGIASAADIKVQEVWSRATPPGAVTGAIFAELSNAGAAPDQLIGAEVAATVADKVEVHQSSKSSDGVMHMAPVAAVEIPAGGEVELKPGSYHIMLFGLKQPLIEGQKLPVTLIFAKAGKLEAKSTIAGIAATESPECDCHTK
jgi:periplasmic copper chaperone A